MPRQITNADLELLAEAVAAEQDDEPFDPGERHEPEKRKPWRPRLNESQEEIFNDQSQIVGACGPKNSGKCVSPHRTIVYTTDGLVKLARIGPDSAPFGFSPIKCDVRSFADGKIGTSRANAYYREEYPAAIRMTFSNGSELTASPQHPLWCCWEERGEVQFGYVKAQELEEMRRRGCRAWTPSFKHPSFTKGAMVSAAGVVIDEEIAYLLGALCGDGSLNKADEGRSLAFSNIDAECIKSVEVALERLGATLKRSSHRHACEYRINKSAKLRKLVVACGLATTSYFKSIPDQIIESPKSVLAAFMSGLFDTDGTVDGVGYVGFCTTSERLSLEVQTILGAFGVLSARRPKKSASGRPTWTISVNGEYAVLFKNEIGFRITRNQNRITEPRVSIRNPYLFKRHHYGYPDPIRGVLRQIAVDSRFRTQDRGVLPRFKKRSGKFKTSWTLRWRQPWDRKPIRIKVGSFEETIPLLDELVKKRAEHYSTTMRNRAWHDLYKGLHSWGSVPCEGKLKKFVDVYKCADALAEFTISSVWLEAVGFQATTSDLADLSVPGAHSFLANGLINHNTIGFAEKIIRHCYEEWNALYTIIGTSADALKDGICDDLTSFVIPQWRDGNREPRFLRENGILVPNPRAGELIDSGMGLEATHWRQDNQTKHIFIKIRNRFGGWSRMKVISIPYPQMIDERIRGPAPSGIYLEEATKCRSNAYVKFPILQLERRRDIVGPQQFGFTCNPEDPDNWVFKWMYKEVVVGADQPGRNWPRDPEQPGIRRRANVSFYFVDYRENAHNVSQKNIQLLEDELASDPILHTRLVKGRWISYPSGDALFKNEFSEARHMRGKAPSDKGHGGQGLLPILGYPIVLGYDFGQRSHGTSFQQVIETSEGPFIYIFDELCYHRKMIKSGRLAHAMVEKLHFWNEWLREKAEDQRLAWCVWHVAGDDATTVYRPGSDSVDAKDMQDKTRAIIEAEPERYRGIEPFLIRGCPRPPLSVSKRTDLFAEAMIDNRILVSQLCPWHRGMFFHLEADKDSPSEPKRSKWLETYDAATYPSLYQHLVLPGGFYDAATDDLVSVKA